MKTLWLVIVMGVLWGGEFLELRTAAADEQVLTDPAAKQPRKTEAYFAPYLLGTFPVNKDMSIGGNGFATETFWGTNVKGSAGGGLKAGVYPGATRGMLGLEGEFFGHAGKLKAPDGRFPSADATLLVLNSMVNILARYPGDIIQPYVGAGIGVSAAHLRDINFRTSSGTLTGKASDVAFAYQFLAGVRAYVQKKVFLFGEYKYFGSSYDWKSETLSGGAGPTTSLTFHTHLAAAGLGVSF